MLFLISKNQRFNLNQHLILVLPILAFTPSCNKKAKDKNSFISGCKSFVTKAFPQTRSKTFLTTYFLQLSSPLAFQKKRMFWEKQDFFLLAIHWSAETRRHKTKGWIERTKAHNILFIQWSTQKEWRNEESNEDVFLLFHRHSFQPRLGYCYYYFYYERRNNIKISYNFCLFFPFFLFPQTVSSSEDFSFHFPFYYHPKEWNFTVFSLL